MLEARPWGKQTNTIFSHYQLRVRWASTEPTAQESLPGATGHKPQAKKSSACCLGSEYHKLPKGQHRPRAKKHRAASISVSRSILPGEMGSSQSQPRTNSLQRMHFWSKPQASQLISARHLKVFQLWGP